MGDLSDRFDRRHIMAVSFVLCGVGIGGLVVGARANSRILFLIGVVLAVFFWSPQYTLFPSVVGDYYGEEHSSANYALLYSGKMWGGVFGGTITGAFVVSLGWNNTFLLGGVLAILAGAAALLLEAPTPPADDSGPSGVDEATPAGTDD
jgi:OFA family oxalate/formate antiporter-like MFS transporter